MRIIPDGTPIQYNIKVQKDCGNTIERHCRPECPAEIDQRGAGPCLRIKWFIGKTKGMALMTGESFDKNVHRSQVFVFLQDGKLFLLRIVP